MRALKSLKLMLCDLIKAGKKFSLASDLCGNTEKMGANSLEGVMASRAKYTAQRLGRVIVSTPDSLTPVSIIPDASLESRFLDITAETRRLKIFLDLRETW